MNGLLAWSEGMGMPMRPAMSVMETTDTPPVSAARRRRRPSPSHRRPATPPGVARHATVEVRDTDTGEPGRPTWSAPTRCGRT